MIFLRHPTPDIDLGICYGQTDMDIAEIGHSQIEDALISTPKIELIVASPALRCRKLATELAKRDAASLEYDERLWEMNMGNFEGVRWDAMDRSQSDKWLEDPFNNPTPNGESFAQVQTRVLAAVEDHLHMHPNVAFVCHAGPIRSVQMAWHGKSFKEVFSQTPAYATPIRLDPTLQKNT